MKDTALKIAGTVFFVMAIVHLLRVFWGFEIIIAGYVLPVWASMAAFVFLLFLSLWMFKSLNASSERRQWRINR